MMESDSDNSGWNRLEIASHISDAWAKILHRLGSAGTLKQNAHIDSLYLWLERSTSWCLDLERQCPDVQYSKKIMENLCSCFWPSPRIVRCHFCLPYRIGYKQATKANLYLMGGVLDSTSWCKTDNISVKKNLWDGTYSCENLWKIQSSSLSYDHNGAHPC